MARMLQMRTDKILWYRCLGNPLFLYRFSSNASAVKTPPVHLDGPAIVFLATGGYNGKGKMIKWETDNGRFIEPYYF